ncbi:MAG: DUF58 domain-containing protein [Actinomycetia bacterium]|nr:DUF58 domain-containing protein [Actinomycetes bacterium]
MTTPGPRPQPFSNEQISPRALFIVGAIVFGLGVGVIVGRPEVIVLTSPLLILFVVGVVLHRWPDIDLVVEGPARCVEGDEIELTVTATTTTGIPWLQLDVELPPDLDAPQRSSQALISMAPGRRTTVTFPVIANRWGVSSPGLVSAIARDRFGLFIASRVIRPHVNIRVHPHEGSRRALVAPARLHRRVGAHGSRAHGEGSDFAEVRPWRPGDPSRAINWRVSARRGDRWVTTRHPDQSGDLVLLIDSFRDLGVLGDRLVQRSVRAALELAESSLAVHDRVGVLDVGRTIRWYRPTLGRMHKAHLTDALLETHVEPGLRPPRLEQLPLHELQQGTLIVALTGLLDPGAALLPLELRARGLEVAAVEVSAEAHLPADSDPTQILGQRLWRLRRAALAKQMREGGVNLVTWNEGQPIELIVTALARRSVRRVGTS